MQKLLGRNPRSLELFWAGFGGDNSNVNRPWETGIKVKSVSPNNLKVETRTTKPADVDRNGKLAVLREPKIISLVFDVFICMLLIAVQDRTEWKICGISLVKHDEGINSHNVVSSAYLCDLQGAHRSLIMTINDSGPSWEPCDMPFNDFQAIWYAKWL